MSSGSPRLTVSKLHENYRKSKKPAQIAECAFTESGSADIAATRDSCLQACSYDLDSANGLAKRSDSH